MIVRISKGTFDPIDLEEVERLAVESELSLRDALQRMPGLVHCYVGIDREVGAVTNLSVWDTLEHARAIDELAPMRALRAIMEDAGVVFEAITNHEVQWSVIGAAGTPA